MAMILLDPKNKILEELVSSLLMSGDDVGLEANLNDFDDVAYFLLAAPKSIPEGQARDERVDPGVLLVSMSMPWYSEIRNLGGQAALEKNFPGMSTTPINGFDITLRILVDDHRNDEDLVKKLGLLKAKVLGGVFDHFITAVLNKESVDDWSFNLRHDTTIYFCPREDRVIIIFGLDFKEHTDKVMAKVFLQEFEDSGKRIGGSPPVRFSTEPPAELKENFGVTENPGILGYFSFGLLQKHLKDKEKAIATVQGFRSYLQYHLKCTHSYKHQRMRARVVSLLKVLERAKKASLEPKEKKTAKGKTFIRS